MYIYEFLNMFIKRKAYLSVVGRITWSPVYQSSPLIHTFTAHHSSLSAL